jgi:hypothetical protein
VTYGNGKIIATSQLSDFTNVSERCTHNNGLVTEFLVVIVDGLDGCNTWIFGTRIGLSGLGLVPIQDTADEGRDEESTSFSSSDGLGLGEQESEVGVDAVVALQNTSCLNTFPGRCDLNQDARLIDSEFFV